MPYASELTAENAEDAEDAENSYWVFLCGLGGLGDERRIPPDVNVRICSVAAFCSS
jgi:hypothetical protein